MTAALRFFAGDSAEITELNAYLDNKPITDMIKGLLDQAEETDEVLILTDLLAGSVNQAFYPYCQSRPHTHLLTGMNMALGLSLLLEPADDYLSEERVREIVNVAREDLLYMNDWEPEVADDDE